jgi:hypothetical protein
MSNKNDPRTVAVAYLEAVGRKDFQAFEGLLAPDVTFKGPTVTLSGAGDVSAAFKRFGPILLRNDLRKMFVDGDEVCIIYDFVTDTPGGAVPTVEWIKIQDGKVRSIWLLTDHLRWPAALEDLGRRAAQNRA